MVILPPVETNKEVNIPSKEYIISQWCKFDLNHYVLTKPASVQVTVWKTYLECNLSLQKVFIEIFTNRS